MAKPIIPWPGGKRRLLKYLLSDIPSHTTYVETFAGGAALLLAKEPSKAEVVNDLNGELVRLYRWALSSREMFRWAQLQRPETLTDIQRAARFYFMQKLAFGGKVAGQTFGVTPAGPARFNLLRMEEDLSQAHLRLTRVTIECLPWQACVERYDRPGTLFFFDPPYWETVGYGNEFGLDQYEGLAGAMRRLKGRAMLTINDHPAMRQVFSGFRAERVRIDYTVGGGDKPKAAGELIYRTW